MKFPLFDAHCDTLSAMLGQETSLRKNHLHVDLLRGGTYSPMAQFFAVFGEVTGPEEQMAKDLPAWESGYSCFWAQYDLLQQGLAENRDMLAFCRSAREAELAARAGKIAAFLSVEGAEILDCSLERLTEAHGQGVRMVTLTWNNPNALSGTNLKERDRGLSDLGRQFVRRCQALGVIVDVSHLSEPGFWDVAEEMAGRPFVASHSNAASLCPHSRNLTDRQFLEIVKARGVAGINLYTAFLGGEKPDVSRVVAHMEHFLALGGEKALAMGADLDGCDSLPLGIKGVEDMEKIAEELLRKNYSEALVCDIMYHNLFRVVEEVCGI